MSLTSDVLHPKKYYALAAHMVYDHTSSRLVHMTANGRGEARDVRPDKYPTYVAKNVRAKGLCVKSVSVLTEVGPSKSYYSHDKTDPTTVLLEPTKSKSEEGGPVGKAAVP